ncbi:MAG: peptidase [Phycisphaerales bacterium]|nr:peptidase [Phycisphaerales bacterium]
MLIVDAHLDLAYNAVRGRDVTRPAVEQTPDKEGVPSVGLPDLRAGGVGLICATIFCQPVLPNEPGYRTAEEAALAASKQLDWYQRQVREGRMRFVTRRDELPISTSNVAPSGTGAPPASNASAGQGQAARATNAQAAILLLEGADAIRTLDDLPAWFDAGLRIVGLAWKRTRYAGGTGAPGPLTADGVTLVGALDRLSVIHDISHLAEESFWQLLEISGGPVMASHSNCRAIVPTDRQVSDEMARALFGRGGMIGINFFDKFLLSPNEQGKRRAMLADVVRHVKHLCDLAGDARHVGLGTDMDGGLGREQIPQEIQTSADLPRLADALAAGGFDDDAVRGILGENWLRYFQANLPR